MHPRHLAKDRKIMCPVQGYDLGQFAFKACGGVGHPRCCNGFTGGTGDLCMGKFIHAPWPRARALVHHIAHLVAHEIDTKHPRLANIGHAILGVAAIRFGRGRGEHHLWRHIGDCVEKGIRRKIVLTIAPPCRNPPNRARCDYGIERVVGQGVAVIRFIEHRRAFCFFGLALS